MGGRDGGREEGRVGEMEGGREEGRGGGGGRRAVHTNRTICEISLFFHTIKNVGGQRMTRLIHKE